MNFLMRAVWIFTAPNRVFDDIRERRVSWPQAWVLSSLMYMIVAWVAMPIQRAVLEVNPDLTAEQIEQQIEFLDRLGLVWVALAPIGVLVITLVMAGLSYIGVTLASRAATFKQYLTLSFFAGIVSMMGQLISAVMIRARGLDRIAGPEDAQSLLSLRALAPEGNAVVRGVLGSIEFFALWSLVLIVGGLVRVFGLTRGQGVGVAVLLWFLYVVMMVLAEVFGSMAG